jgi:hypothetical protein
VLVDKRNPSKRPRRTANTDDGTTVLPPTQPPGDNTAEEKALEFAEDLGRLFGTVQRKANDWLNQRQEVVKTLTRLRDSANQLLGQLGDQAGTQRRRGRGRATAADATNMQARQTVAASDTSIGTAGRRKRKGMTAAQRKAVGERMRKYWAQRRRSESR